MALLSPVPHELSFQWCALKTPSIPAWLLQGMSKQAAQHRADAESPRGARGVLQVMPHVAAAHGVDPDALWNPTVNACLAAKLLKIQYDRVTKRYPRVSRKDALLLTMAVNNAGWSAVRPKIDQLGTPAPTWTEYSSRFTAPVSVEHVNRMWGFAIRYRSLDYLLYATLALVAAGAAYAYFARSRR